MKTKLNRIGAVLVTASTLVAVALPVAAENNWPFGPYTDYSGYYPDRVSQSALSDAYRDAAIVGFDKDKLDSAYSASQEITNLKAENASLRSQLSTLDARIRALENGGTQVSSAPSQPVVQTVYQTETADMSRVAAVEKRLNVLEQYLYMVEQRIGEMYARMESLIAPVYKVLKLK